MVTVYFNWTNGSWEVTLCISYSRSSGTTICNLDPVFAWYGCCMQLPHGLVLTISILYLSIYYKIIIQKLIQLKTFGARVLLLIIGAAGAYITSFRLTSILGSVAWAFDFAMSGLFFPLVLGVVEESY